MTTCCMMWLQPAENVMVLKVKLVILRVCISSQANMTHLTNLTLIHDLVW